MVERSEEEVVVLTRRELAQLHANEMSAAVNPPALSNRPDDAITEAEKQALAKVVERVADQHRDELALWAQVNG